jgi:phosphomannomutase/phosphoglucomutase
VIPIFCESDGTFPNHHPDPVVDKNLVDIIAKVKETGADLGVAFDGDADRIGAIDDRGEIVRGDTLLLLYGLDLIEKRGPGQKVVFDVKCSQRSRRCWRRRAACRS